MSATTRPGSRPDHEQPRREPAGDAAPAPKPSAPHDSHGHSVAAWTGVSVLLVASAMMSWAVAVTNWPLFAAGAVVAVLGVVAGRILSVAGYGATEAVKRADHDMADEPDEHSAGTKGIA